MQAAVLAQQGQIVATAPGSSRRRGAGSTDQLRPCVLRSVDQVADTGLGVTAFAGSIGAARSTIHLWATRHAEFRDAMEVAAAKRQYRLECDVLELDGSLKPEQVRLRLGALARLDPENWRK